MLRQHRARAAEFCLASGAPPKPDDFVFRKSPVSSEPLPPDRIGQAWSRYCKELGVKARLHDLRHLQTLMLLDAGEAVTVVAARLGHRDTAKTLKVYSHLMPAPTLAQHRWSRLPSRARRTKTPDRALQVALNSLE